MLIHLSLINDVLSSKGILVTEILNNSRVFILNKFKFRIIKEIYAVWKQIVGLSPV